VARPELSSETHNSPPAALGAGTRPSTPPPGLGVGAVPTASPPALGMRASSKRGAIPSLIDAAFPPLILLAAVLVFWEVGLLLAGWPSYLLPRPSAVALRLASDPAFFVGQGAITLGEALGGLALGAGGGFAIGAAMAAWRPLERALLPLAILVKVTPVVTIAPLLVLWFGFGPTPKVLIAAILTFFPMVIASVSGLRSVDPTAYDVFRTLGARSFQTFLLLRLPSALPMLLAAAKVCATLALIGTVVAEWVGAERGLGRAILLANTNLDTTAVFAGVVTLGVMGVALVGGLTLLERRLLFWHESQLSQAADREGTA
jgi:NitT/TauT family transport system permease protein